LRIQKDYLVKVFNHGFTVKQLALNSSLSIDAVYKRFDKILDAEVGKKRIIRVRGSKLILIIDAQWQYFSGKLWTLYILSVKSTNSVTVDIFDPVLIPGKENAASWNAVIDNLPGSVKKRVIALVSDGIRGIETIADNNGWIIQRCHFHLLSILQKMRGKRASTPGRLIREEIYQLSRLALTEKSDRRLNSVCRRLAKLAHSGECPKRMKMIIRDFLRRLVEFRNYLDHPELNLPTTVNVMESINSRIRKNARTVNTPEAWRKWAIICVRFKSKFTCK
jgi:hypothetical protein